MVALNAHGQTCVLSLVYNVCVSKNERSDLNWKAQAPTETLELFFGKDQHYGPLHLIISAVISRFTVHLCV